MRETVIIGAGIAGLGALSRLNEGNVQCTVLEKENRIGGLCRTESCNGFQFDYTGHLLHFRNDIFKSKVFSVLADNIDHRQRNAWIYSKNVYTKYPFQANLYGLPTDVIVECIYEYSRRHFNPYTDQISNFREWIDAYFGSGIARHFMVPYNSKIYRTDLSELSPDCGGRFVPQSDLKLLLQGALGDVSGVNGLGYNSDFYYPVRGGIEVLVKALAANTKISVNEKVEKINLQNKTISTSKGRVLPYEKIISTQPLNELVDCINCVPDQIRSYGEKLKYVSVLNINLGISSNVSDKHWVYVPEDNYLFHRIGFPHNFSDYMAPKNHSSIYIEISYDSQKGINIQKAMEQSVSNLLKLKLLQHPEQIAVKNIIDITYAYVIFDHNRQKCLSAIKDYLKSEGIYTAGRFGSWDYFSMEDAFMDGWNTASKHIIKG